MLVAKAILVATLFSALYGEESRLPTAREMTPPAGARDGVLGIEVDALIHNNAQKDLSDIRIVENGKHAVPYRIVRGDYSAPEPQLFDCSITALEAGRWLVERGDEAKLAQVDQLILTVSDLEFSGLFTVEGKLKDGAMQQIATDRPLYRFKAPYRELKAQGIGLKIPKGAYSKLTIIAQEGLKPEALTISGCRLAYLGRDPEDSGVAAGWEKEFAAKFYKREVNPNLGYTSFQFKIDNKGQPINRLQIETDDPNFVHYFEAEGSPSKEVHWSNWGSGVLFRKTAAKFHGENLEIKVSPQTYPVANVSVWHKSAPAVKVKGLRAFGTSVVILFPYKAGKNYTLLYGNKDVSAPTFHRKFMPPTVPEKRVAIVSLGDEIKSEVFKTKDKPDKTFTRQDQVELFRWILGFAVVIFIVIVILGRRRKSN